ncbi:MAG TPA: Fic family protein [Solirubrobacterales bacterium]|nr:Fic family protein [Solirubrobacterales bacterium]
MLVIGERELRRPAEQLKDVISIPDALRALQAPFPGPGEVDRYPHPVEKSAVCCSRILRAHLFPDGNKRIAFECMCEMLARAGHPWSWEPRELDEIVAMVDRLQARTISEAEFVAWVRERATA